MLSVEWDIAADARGSLPGATDTVIPPNLTFRVRRGSRTVVLRYATATSKGVQSWGGTDGDSVGFIDGGERPEAFRVCLSAPPEYDFECFLNPLRTGRDGSADKVSWFSRWS